MTNLCTKVTVRQRKLAKGKVSLYLDYYSAIRHPRTGRMTRREYLGIYIYANPTERFQQEYNRSMMKKAELIKCRRTESVINEWNYFTVTPDSKTEKHNGVTWDYSSRVWSGIDGRLYGTFTNSSELNQTIKLDINFKLY